MTIWMTYPEPARRTGKSASPLASERTVQVATSLFVLDRVTEAPMTGVLSPLSMMRTLSPPADCADTDAAAIATTSAAQKVRAGLMAPNCARAAWRKQKGRRDGVSRRPVQYGKLERPRTRGADRTGTGARTHGTRRWCR